MNIVQIIQKELNSRGDPSRTDSMFERQALSGRTDWRIYFAAILTLAILSGTSVLMFFVVYANIVTDWINISEISGMETLSGSEPFDLRQFLFSIFFYTFFLGSLFFVTKKIHRRRLSTLITAKIKFDLSLLVKSFLMTICGIIIFSATHYMLFFEQYSLNKNWHLFDFIYIFLILIFSVLFEEIVFRGYVLQLVGAYISSILIILIAPSLLFFVLHISKILSPAGTYSYISYLLPLSLYLTWTAIMGNGLEIGIGLHTAFNLSAFVFSHSSLGFSANDSPIMINGTGSTYWLCFSFFVCGLHYTCVRSWR